MQLPSCIAIFRFAFFGSLCLLSVVHAHPASAVSSSETNPGSLLGRSYSHRAENPPILPRFRPLVVDSQTQQLDAHVLGRADRFRVAQRRAAASSSSINAGVEAARAVQDVETRDSENLLSHEELPALPTPSAVDPNTILPASTSATSASSSTTSTTTTAAADASPSTRLAEKHDKSSKKQDQAHGSHKGRKSQKTIQYAPQE